MKCSKCNIEKEIRFFQKSSLIISGYLNHCKLCGRQQRGRKVSTFKEGECTICLKILPADYFKYSRSRANNLNFCCVNCEDNLRTMYNATTKLIDFGSYLKTARTKFDKEHRIRINEGKKESFKNTPVSNMFLRAKRRARVKGYEFTIDKSDIIIPEFCPVLGIELKVGSKDYYEYTPTIDRVDNSKGYTPDNIQIISKKANSMKNSATFEEIEKLYIYMKAITRDSLNNKEQELIEVGDKEPLR